MKRHTYTQLIAALAILMIGCTSVPTLYGTLEDWKGGSIDEAFKAWGRPGSVQTTAKGTTYTWVTEVEYTNHRILTCQKTIVTDTKGKILTWSYAGHQGAGCF